MVNKRNTKRPQWNPLEIKGIIEKKVGMISFWTWIWTPADFPPEPERLTFSWMSFPVSN